jgi:DNA invertase Pin-like site-specific DNA recombinase
MINKNPTKVLYTRVSTNEQNSKIQKLDLENYDIVVEDKCSGAIPFFERNGGKEMLNLVKKDSNIELNVWSIDRLERDTRCLLNTIHFFTSKGICINFFSQGLKTLNENGSENTATKMVIPMLGVVAQMERNAIMERTRKGIEIAKMEGKYKGRNKGTVENVSYFLSKPKNKEVLGYIKKGYKNSAISKITGISINTIVKIRKYANS